MPCHRSPMVTWDQSVGFSTQKLGRKASIGFIAQQARKSEAANSQHTPAGCYCSGCGSMLASLAGTFRAIFFGLILVFAMLLLWAIVAAQVIITSNN